jgi:putative FmdB family regulatory protein
MPLYSYVCDKCDVIHEVMVPLSQFDEEILCPDCGEPLERMISPVYFKVY